MSLQLVLYPRLKCGAQGQVSMSHHVTAQWQDGTRQRSVSLFVEKPTLGNHAKTSQILRPNRPNCHIVNSIRVILNDIIIILEVQ